jgi:hypothetical protein
MPSDATDKQWLYFFLTKIRPTSPDKIQIRISSLWWWIQIRISR